VLLNKRVSTIDILFHTDEEAPLQTKRLRILDSIVLFAAAAVAASGYPKTHATHECSRRARIANVSRFIRCPPAEADEVLEIFQ
jgi:hypothetical protein